ncbi:cation transporter [Geofilum sp. OHC36d9]|uniref:cation transporter n=1 Tax=Geofilum sp. OHC36d9 TaxID=3458413 RepID=UPI004033ECF5
MVVFALNLLFTVIEFVGGIFTNLMAILSDAIHDLGDTVAIGGDPYGSKKLLIVNEINDLPVVISVFLS